MKKKIPHFKTDKEMEDFLEQDLSDYMHPENFSDVTFEFEPKSEKVNLRVTPSLLKKIKLRAKRVKMPYQRYIRHVIEHALNTEGTL
jgi:predicted DNA binding CopG/RHH family protein